MNISEQVGPDGAAARIAAFGPDRFYNRELSWLNFNKRVMEEAGNERQPLLERLRFLSISANNLDEFYMVRVAGLRAQVVAGIETPSQDGLTPTEQLDRINESVADLTANQQETWVTLEALLGEAGIHVLSADQLAGQERTWLEDHFLNHIFPVLTPIAVDPAHPFPFIPNFGFTLGLELVREGSFRTMHALLPIPPQLDRFIRLPAEEGSKEAIRFIRLETVVGIFVSRLFPGYRVRSQGAFRVVRDSDIEVQEEAEDLVRVFESALKRRKRGSVIRLEMEATMPSRLQRFVMQELKVSERESFVQKGLIGLADTNQLIVSDRPDLKFQPFVSRFPERIREHHGDCFAAIAKKDIIVHGASVPEAGHRRSGCCGDQMDALPHQQDLADHRGAEGRRRGRQVGHGGGRAEGAVRRGSQHQMGARSGKRGRPGGLRLYRAEDPRQAEPDRPPRARRTRHLLSRGHRQLPPGHGQNLYGSLVLHG
jgi:polyphosphate kinase